ncbi:helix-turn-helix domain-containing protein [Nocardia arizonensis]|uniref:helix-turn-helix domain-containing protein n=1 Tax=Nocardia arizonensis TaxID=1141647 RepID=UPI0006D0BFEB|nr:helix-turn-helix domain-containing protein [Nocardia arizonensis]
MDVQLATPAEVAQVLRTTPARLANDRHRGRGIPYVKNGASVLYRWDDVRDWIERNTERPGAA